MKADKTIAGVKEKRKNIIKEKGITLIALIVTIIVMLILVGVSIQLTINSGLINSAGNAVNKHNKKTDQEQSRADELMGVLEKVEESQETEDNPKEEAKAGEKASKTLPYYSNGKTAMIPGGFTVSGVPSESTIDGGLVIYLIEDKTEADIAGIDWTDEAQVEELQTTYDQFVWIPIAKENINDMYMCQNEDGTKSCKITVQEVDGEEVAYCTTHSSTQMAGRLYATTTGENFNTKLTTQNHKSSVLREPDIITSYDNNTTYLGYLNGILETSFAISTDFKTYLQEEYNEIVKSVYENEGFYVGRYETSNITETNGTEIKVVAGVTQSNGINWYYMYAQQKDYATNKGLTNTIRKYNDTRSSI